MKLNQRHFRPHENGFTIVEIVVTLALTSLFLMFFFQMYLATESQRINVARQAQASDIAYSNLRKITARPAGITCDAAKMDLTATDGATKPGLLIGDQTNMSTPSVFGFVAEPEPAIKGLGGNVEQIMKVYAPRGCDGTAFADNPIKLESTVMYGPNREKVTHAIYID